MPPKSTVSSSFSVKEGLLAHEEETSHSAALDVISWVCQIMSWRYFNPSCYFIGFIRWLYRLGRTKSLKGYDNFHIRPDLGILPGGATSSFIRDGGDIKSLTLITFIAIAL